jgi:PIN domain nuclease of toxin-antitoxin system
LKLLLDTHILLWVLAEPDKLPDAARDLIVDVDNAICASAAAIWEIAIKHGRKRGRPDDMPISGEQAVLLFETAAIALIDITPAHTAAVGQLLHLHGDPFDRLMVAQAKADGFTLLTHDSKLSAYGDFVMVV